MGLDAKAYILNLVVRAFYVKTDLAGFSEL
jgi:hypothetical protein